MHVTKGSKLALFEGIQYVFASNAVELLTDTEMFTFKNDNPHFMSLFLLFIFIFNVVVCCRKSEKLVICISVTCIHNVPRNIYTYKCS
jgi:hypothetical protein